MTKLLVSKKTLEDLKYGIETGRAGLAKTSLANALASPEAATTGEADTAEKDDEHLAELSRAASVAVSLREELDDANAELKQLRAQFITAIAIEPTEHPDGRSNVVVRRGDAMEAIGEVSHEALSNGSPAMFDLQAQATGG